MPASTRTPSPASARTVPPAAQMLDLITGYWVSQLVFVAARLGIADELARGPKTAAELAPRVGAQSQPLHRLLRALASVGVFAETDGGRFELTPLAATLRSDAPDSMRGFAIMMVDGYNFDAWVRLIDGVQEDCIPFERVHGMRPFDWFAEHPEDARRFNESMTSLSRTEVPVLAAAYDWSPIKLLVEIGGGHGHLLAAILRRAPHLQGILSDQASVIERSAKEGIATAPDIAARCKLHAADFFKSVPPGGDAYIMKYILHDWNDAECITILRHCRQAMAKGGRVLVVDNVIPPGNDKHWGKLLDINMLVCTGGRERTESEFAEIFRQAGLRLTRVVPTACPLSIVEGVAA